MVNRVWLCTNQPTSAPPANSAGPLYLHRVRPDHRSRRRDGRPPNPRGPPAACRTDAVRKRSGKVVARARVVDDETLSVRSNCHVVTGGCDVDILRRTAGAIKGRGAGRRDVSRCGSSLGGESDERDVIQPERLRAASGCPCGRPGARRAMTRALAGSVGDDALAAPAMPECARRRRRIEAAARGKGPPRGRARYEPRPPEAGPASWRRIALRGASRSVAPHCAPWRIPQLELVGRHAGAHGTSPARESHGGEPVPAAHARAVQAPS